MKLVKESISFERGVDPKEILGIGDPIFAVSISEEMKKLMKEFEGNKFEIKTNSIDGEVSCFFNINRIVFYMAFSKNAILRFSVGYFGWYHAVFSKKSSKYLNQSKQCSSVEEAVKILKTYLKIQTKY